MIKTMDLSAVDISVLRAWADAGVIPLNLYIAECARRGIGVAA